MILRLAAVVALTLVAFVAVSFWEKRRLAPVAGIGTGMTLVTAAHCQLCPAAILAARSSGVEVNVVDIGSLAGRSITSVPTALVVDAGGKLIARRSGRSVVADMATLAALSRSVA